ncbi:MAG TPA: hypothetical protein VHP30_09425 [Ignavibacteriales bacterium]|nr:hypothetical protein [Ignavibacteriales bacterium]
MTKGAKYLEELANLKGSLEEYLKKNSGLPGPRGNLELLITAIENLPEEKFAPFWKYTADIAQVNTPEEYLYMFPVVSTGYHITKNDKAGWARIRAAASDTRWRTREAVTMATIYTGLKDFDFLLKEMQSWAKGNLYERRASAAALCEPKLLDKEEKTVAVLNLLKEITDDIPNHSKDEEGFEALVKGFSFCWSVAICGAPKEGKRIFETLLKHEDKFIKKIVKENLSKNRLKKIDEVWVNKMIKSIK